MPTRVAQSESTDDGRDEFEQSDELDYGESQPLMRAHTVGEGDAAAASSATICGMPKQRRRG